MKNAISANWVAENGVATATGFNLKGSSKGYASFMKAFTDGDQVFYSAHDDRGNREAGYATFNGSNLVNRHATATLYNGVYQHQSPPKINFSGEITIACTFNAAAFNVLWKALDAMDPDGDGNINIPPELIDGLVAALDSKAEQADLEAEITARIAGDKALQDQIDAIDPDGNRTVSWDEVEGKPSAFPPATHNHDGDYIKDEADPTVPDHVKGITETDIDNWNAGGGGASTWDELTGKPTEFPPEAHTHEQSEVDGLETRLEAIEDSITSGGGFVDAPDDGKLYGRQSEAWAEVVIPDAVDPDWADIQNKPTEFPPESHDHDLLYSKLGHTHPTSDVNGLDAALGEITGDISDLEGAVGSLSGQLAFGGSYDAATGLVVKANLDGYEQGQALPDASTVLDTFVIVSIAGNNPEELSEGDWLVAGVSGWVPIKYGTAGTVDWSNIENAPDFDALYAEADHGHEEITKDAAYIKYVVDKWEASPAMSVTGDFDVGGETSLTGNLNVGGGLDVNAGISLGGDLSIGGKIEGDLTVNGNITIDGGGSISNPSGDEYLTDAPSDTQQYARQDGAWTVVNSSGGNTTTGGMVISPTEPVDKITGMMWLESTTARVWIWDEDKWLEFPAAKVGGSGGDTGGDGTLPPFTEISEVVSTFLYGGNGTSQTITNNVDLAGKGGLVWIKNRAYGGHYLFDTERGPGKYLETTEISGESAFSNDVLQSFNSDGFDLGSSDTVNKAGDQMVSWTFRKAKNFFDIVTYTGDGVAGREIPHGLGCEPGMIIVKCTDKDVYTWIVYHKGVAFSSPENYYLDLRAGQPRTAELRSWNETAPTSTDFTLGTQHDVNIAGATYVAYLFAHDDSNDSIIKCGRYSGNGNANGPDIDLGWEPQWVFLKNASRTGSWYMLDTMRGIATDGQDARLWANSGAAEAYSEVLNVTSTGFKIKTAAADLNENGREYSYMAIRKDPNALRNPDFDAQNAEVQAKIAAREAAKDAVKEKVKDKASERKKR